jgi:hypothetical protein
VAFDLFSSFSCLKKKRQKEEKSLAGFSGILRSRFSEIDECVPEKIMRTIKTPIYFALS